MDDQSFFSIDRLVEFGLGMGIAQQMVGMMNQYMQQMYVPGSIQSMPKPMPNAEPKPVEMALIIVAEPGENTVLLKKSPNYLINLYINF